MPEKHGMKSLDLRKVCKHDSGCFVDLFPIESYRGLKKLERSIILGLIVHHSKNMAFLDFSTNEKRSYWFPEMEQEKRF